MNTNNDYPSKIIRYISIASEVIRERGLFFFMGFFFKMELNTFLVKFNNIYSVAYARSFNRPLVHVIGDSHSWAFKRTRSFIVHNIGPATAYNLKNKNSTIRSNQKLFSELGRIDLKKDLIILVFGEIDCRVHIYNQYRKSQNGVTMEEFMDRAISNYGEVLEQLRNAGVNFVVYGVIPAPKQIFRYPPYATERMRRELFDEFRSSYPFLATPEIRSWINRTFNEKLRAFCEKNGYGYIDIYPEVADQDGFIADAFSADEIHVNGRIMPFIKSQLKKKYGIMT
ncbi:MAG TPA: SGNH/GDSL hydrolase family protein [Methanocella sp.]|uniref:SGNH/GDSL hydrolase family protein n=1 Tax=Methanocella sp. TaxID=2052833 RepID=UPI002C167C72|nr:SGNH/GDSL hydrolase family protein [Methanocella sp.]HTY91884.1 SGNH/GDSL hydrolase family protein [Methanocella sp.]